MVINPGLINLWIDDKKALLLKELRSIQAQGYVGNDDERVKLIEDIVEDVFGDAKRAETLQHFRGR